MVTAVISDLHLGTRTKGRPAGPARYSAQPARRARRGGQVVLLGDSIELRDGPLRDALERARPLLRGPGRRALGAPGLTLVPGNHDHRLASRWLARRGHRHAGVGAASSTLTAGTRSTALAGAHGRHRAVLAYPGVWLREDVYATHGHYLDCHNDVRTFECMARAPVERVTQATHGRLQTPADDYEAVLAPVYRTIYRVVQSRRARRAARVGKAAVRRWERLHGYRGPRARPGVARDGTGGPRLRESTPTMSCSDTCIGRGRGGPRAETSC